MRTLAMFMLTVMATLFLACGDSTPPAQSPSGATSADAGEGPG
jgi:hypothetical protein